MTPDQFKQARQSLGLSQERLAAIWNMGANGGRSIRRWECGERPVNPIAAYAIRLMVADETRAAPIKRRGPEC